MRRPWRMIAGLRPLISSLTLLISWLLASALPIDAAEWGGIQPGVSTPERVRERWGAPSKETKQKVEGYDTVQWLYEGSRAPEGMVRMTVDFGLLTPAGYQPNVVRLLTLEPRPGIFGMNTVLQGWGDPDGFTGKEKENLSFFFREGLLVFFDKEDFATRMVFSVPQPNLPAGTSPPGAGGAPGAAPASPPSGQPSPAAPPGSASPPPSGSPAPGSPSGQPPRTPSGPPPAAPSPRR